MERRIAHQPEPCIPADPPTPAALETMDRDALIALWPRIMGGVAPRSMSQGIMRRFLAFELQVRSGGGLTPAELDRLRRMAAGTERAPSRRMAPGARFLREWNGVTHVVERSAAGYIWNGQTHTSLSAIARKIIGAHWSGPRFFGLKAGAEGLNASDPGERKSAARAKSRSGML